MNGPYKFIKTMASAMNNIKTRDRAKELHSGTTTVGIVVQDAVILGADKRATMEYYVASKTAEKIQKIRDHIFGTIAGSVADAQYLMDFIRVRADLYEMERGRKIPVNTLVKMLSQKLFGAKYPMPYEVHHIIGGVDHEGPKLYDVYGDGSIGIEKFTSTGSGSLFAFGVLEAGYKDGMTIEEGVELVRSAVDAAISRDIFSGNGIDMVIIKKDSFEMKNFKPKVE
nr:proteasome subunit beta [Candidatus Sigynarchaeota archaeon]